MTQVCARCDSPSIIPDYEKGKQVGEKCMMCGMANILQLGGKDRRLQ